MYICLIIFKSQDFFKKDPTGVRLLRSKTEVMLWRESNSNLHTKTDILSTFYFIFLNFCLAENLTHGKILKSFKSDH